MAETGSASSKHTAEIASTAAQPRRAHGVGNRSAGLARASGAMRRGGIGRDASGPAISKTCLAACAAVRGWILDLEKESEVKIDPGHDERRMSHGILGA
jgi:hypothetical protein